MIRDSTRELRFNVQHTLARIHDRAEFKELRSPVERAQMDTMLKSFLFGYFYYMISDNGRLLPHMFTSVRKEEFPTDLEDACKANLSKPWFTIDERATQVQNNHAGRNCGRKFKVGEPIYRCKECSFDDTCVLCVHCFNSKDHEGHHVYTSICTEFNNGICDCGDEEAWNHDIHCKAEEESDFEENGFDDQDAIISENLEAVLTELFDHFIDVFNQNIEPLPTIQKPLTSKLRDFIQNGKYDEQADILEQLAYTNEYMEEQKRTNRDPSPSLSPLQHLKDYTVLIYNDEFHNYAQASTAIRQGGPDNKHIDLLTAKIDSEGRSMLKCSKDLSSLMGGFFSVQTNGLSCTLTQWSEYIHQETCKYSIMWINDCLNIPNSSFQNLIRSVIGKVLCSRYEPSVRSVDMTSVVRDYFSDDSSEDNPYFYADYSVLGEGIKIPLGHHKSLDPSDMNIISPGLNKVIEEKEYDYHNTRLQFILFFENRYWKKLRKIVQDIIIPTLSSSAIYKSQFGDQLVQIFPHMTRNVTYMDREPQLTSLRESVVQLFTCPTTAQRIFTSGQFKNVIWPVIDVFVDFSKIDNGTLVWQRVQRSNPSKSYSISFKQGLYAVETLLSKITDPNLLLNPSEFIMIVTLCKLFNGAWKIKRKEGEHVLREDQHFIPYLEYTTSIYSIIQTFDKVLEQSKASINNELLVNGIRLLDSFLSHRNLTYKLYKDIEIIQFQISKQRVSLMNPVHTLFSFLIQHVPLKVSMEVLSNSKDFLVISDFALRSVVLCSQIDVGFWVRNGMSVLHQSSYYKNNPEMSSYSRDIQLNQLAFLMEKDNIHRVIFNMLDRWELLEWFDGTTDFTETVYHEKISSIIQQFIAFVYQVLAERDFYKVFDSLEEKQLYDIKNAIIYKLYAEPLSYTALLNDIPDYLTESVSQFDAALDDVSIYIEPKGLEDSGVFKLRKEFYHNVDPLRLHNMGNDFEHSATIIKSYLTDDKEKRSKVVIHPQFLKLTELDEAVAQLGTFTRTDVFAKLIYKLLKLSVSNSEYSFTYELLHLIHGIFIDDEMVNGKNSIPEAYINKPICDLLLNIVDSEGGLFSENVVATADYLLENMILKRPAAILESLTACFGTEYIQRYKARKANQGINFEETELERKKRMAKERQRQIMNKFSKQQQKFIDKQEEYGACNDEDVVMDPEAHGATETSEFDCSLCHDEISDDFFVIPIYQNFSPIFLTSTLAPKELFKSSDGFENNEHCSTDNYYLFYKEKKSGAVQASIECSRKTLVSCNHTVHYQCFKHYIDKKRFTTDLFICPLCQTYSNSVIPIDTIRCDFNEKSMQELIFEGTDRTLISKFMTFPFEYSETMRTTVLSLTDDGKSNRNASLNPKWTKQRILSLALSFCNNIAAVEISSRIDKNSYSSLLQGKEQKFKTLSNILKAIAIYCRVKDVSDEKIEDFYREFTKVQSPNQLFFYIFQMSLRSSLPLCETLMHALALYLSKLVGSYVELRKSGNFSDFEHYGPFLDSAPFFDLLSECLKQAGVDSLPDKVSADMLYTLLVAELLPTLRKTLIFLKVMNEFLIGSQKLVCSGFDLEADFDTSSKESHFHSLLFWLTRHDFNILLQRSLSDTADHPLLKDLPIEYCSIVKLTDLATHLNTYVTNTKQITLFEEENQKVKNSVNRLDYKICLICGVKIHTRIDGLEMSKHMGKCAHGSSGLFLIPNISQVCLFLDKPNCAVNIAAPYLNSHGESGKNAIERGDLTVLNLARYEHLNKLWISNGIPGYISRVMGDEFRVSMANNRTFTRNMFWRPGAAFNATGDTSDDDDLFNDDEFIEDELPELRFRDPAIEWNINTDAFGRDGTFRLPTGRGDIHDFFEFVANLRGATENADGEVPTTNDIIQQLQGGVMNGFFNRRTPDETARDEDEANEHEHEHENEEENQEERLDTPVPQDPQGDGSSDEGDDEFMDSVDW